MWLHYKAHNLIYLFCFLDSAGCGRTGTIMVLDYVRELIKQKVSYNINHLHNVLWEHSTQLFKNNSNMHLSVHKRGGRGGGGQMCHGSPTFKTLHSHLALQWRFRWLCNIRQGKVWSLWLFIKLVRGKFGVHDDLLAHILHLKLLNTVYRNIL